MNQDQQQNQGGGQRDNRQHQPQGRGRGKGKGGGGSGLALGKLDAPDIMTRLARQDQIEDEDRAIVKAEKAEAKAEVAREKASKTAEADRQNIAAVNAGVSAILQDATFAFIHDPLERHWNDFVDAANLTDTERACLYKILAQMPEEAKRRSVIKEIMQVADTAARRQIATDRGLLPS